MSILMTILLVWNYMYNSMDTQNSSFSQFQLYGESWATGVIVAEQKDAHFINESEQDYGLGRYTDLKGELIRLDEELTYKTDDDWLYGYSVSQAAVIVDSNVYSKSVAAVGNYLKCENGETFQILNIEDDGDDIIIYLTQTSHINFSYAH